MHPHESMPLPKPVTHAAGGRPEDGRAHWRSLLDALEALTEQADASGLDLTAARLRAVGKLACAEMVEVRLQGLV